MKRSTFARTLGRDNGDFGEGQGNPQLPEDVPVKFNSFGGGYNASDSDQDVNPASSPDALDMEVNKQDSLVKAPGTVLYEVLDAAKTPRQLMLHVGTAFRPELITIAPPFAGVKSSDGSATQWASTSWNPQFTRPYSWTTFADFALIGNGHGAVVSHEFGTLNFVDEPLMPNGNSFMVSAARLFVGGAVINGVKNPMAMAWSGVDGFNKFDYVVDLGSGFENLIADTAAGDEIMATRPMGLDLAAIICRRSIWIGRRTGDLDRPLDFQPRVVGKGCIAEPTARTVYGGVIYLGTEGLEFFNGNDSVHISDAIDPELLPLDFGNLARYNGSYDPVQQRYYLFTPTATYVYEILKQRWFKRSMIAYGGQPFSETFPGILWADITGTWADMTDTWAGLGGDEKELPIMSYLGRDNTPRWTLHRADPLAFVNFGFPFKPRWKSAQGESPDPTTLVTTKAIQVRYKGAGDLDFYLPDTNAEMTKVTQTPITLLDSLKSRLIEKRSIFTGLGAGFTMEILSGNPQIQMVGLREMPRRPRIGTGGGFEPREYQADF